MLIYSTESGVNKMFPGYIGIMTNNCFLPCQVATMPNSLYHSLQGQYYVGYADNIFFESDKSAWAALYNPYNSGVNLFVNVWTVTDLYEPPVRMQIWLNSRLPGGYTISDLVTPANTAINPLPEARVKIFQASNITGVPEGGIKAFVRRTLPGETVVAEEEGKFVIPPGGNFTIFLSNIEGEKIPASTRVAFGWWEERAYCQK
jgi:hypothetical protein